MIRGISDTPISLSSAVKDIYDELVDQKQLFQTNYHLFSLGLAYGLLHNKKYEKKPNSDFIKINTISDTSIRNLIDLVFLVLDDDRDPKEIWQDMLQIADGGVVALKEIFDKNQNFRIPQLVLDAQQLWNERVKELHNINLK